MLGMTVWGCGNSVSGYVQNFHYKRSWAKKLDLFWCALCRKKEQITSGDPRKSNYSTIIQLPINSKPKASFENTRIVSFLFNTLQEDKVHNSGIHGWINCNREKLGKSSNWIQFRRCLIQGTLLVNSWAALYFLSSLVSFLVQHSARSEDKVHNSDQSRVVSALEEKGMKAEAMFLMRSKRWGAVLTKARKLLEQSSEWKCWGSTMYYMAVLLCSCGIPSCQEFFPLAPVWFGLFFWDVPWKYIKYPNKTTGCSWIGMDHI